MNKGPVGTSGRYRTESSSLSLVPGLRAAAGPGHGLLFDPLAPGERTPRLSKGVSQTQHGRVEPAAVARGG